MLHFPYGSTHLSSDYDETFTSYCKHARGGFGNLKIVLTGVPVHPIAMKLSKVVVIVVNMLAVVF